LPKKKACSSKRPYSAKDLVLHKAYSQPAGAVIFIWFHQDVFWT